MPKSTFTNVIKPTHICNIACTYCYNEDLRDPVMKDGTLLRVIEQTFEYVRKHSDVFSEATFIWHGGEPMAVGIKFYEKVVNLQRALHNGVKFTNLLQTNGLLIDSNWVSFFKEHKFGVGISIDGPRHVHDKYRITLQNKGTFEKAYRGIERLRSAGMPVGACMVLSKATLPYIDEVFDFFVTNKLPLEIIPMNKSGGAVENYQDLGLTEHEYGDAWRQMYDKWLNLDEESYIHCQDFVERTRAIIYGQASSCHSSANCSIANISVDPVGDVFPCVSLSGTDAVNYGNISEESLDDILLSPVANTVKAAPIDPHCATCKWQHVCHGGCTARSYKFYGNLNQRDYYCPSLYSIFEHIEKRLAERNIAPGLPHPLHMSDGFDPALLSRFIGKSRVKGKGTAKTIPIIAVQPISG